MAITTPGAIDYHLASQNASRALAINPQAPCSLLCWINGVVSDTATYSQVGSYNSATAGGTAIQIGHRTAAGRIVVWTWGGLPLVDTANLAGTGVLVAVPDNTWTHYAYTFDGTSSRLYINGVLINVVNNTTGVSTTTTRTGYAAQIAGTLTAVYVNGYPTGILSETSTFSCDDIRFYNRQLADNEIQTIYTSQGSRDGIVNGLVAAFDCDELATGSTASSVFDSTNGLNTLTPVGAAAGVNFTYTSGINGINTRPPL
jgi:hypothetical protein